MKKKKSTVKKKSIRFYDFFMRIGSNEFLCKFIPSGSFGTDDDRVNLKACLWGSREWESETSKGNWGFVLIRDSTVEKITFPRAQSNPTFRRVETKYTLSLSLSLSLILIIRTARKVNE